MLFDVVVVAAGLDAYHLAAMEQLTASCKSVVIAAALLHGHIRPQVRSPTHVRVLKCAPWRIGKESSLAVQRMLNHADQTHILIKHAGGPASCARGGGLPG
jgi:chaperone required for assembly of F1-ATPase